MGSVILFLIFSLFFPSPALAASPDEIYQIISFQWDESDQKLTPFSIGSGTALHKIGLVTNRHVVYDMSQRKPVDLVLLCRADRSRTQRADCSIPGVVTAYHPQIDVALIQPVDRKPLIPSAAPETLKQKRGDQVRIYGFPYSPEQGEFGDKNTLSTLKKWIKQGGKLSNLGDKITITRGTIKTLYRDNFGNVAYYGTNAKGDFGSSGGGAFTHTGKYIGVPSYKDQHGNSILIAYSEIHEWLQKNKNIVPDIEPKILDFYEQNIAPQKQKRTPVTRNYLKPKVSVVKSYRNNNTRRNTWSVWSRRKTTENTESTEPTNRPTYRPTGRLRYLGEP